MRISDWSSDVCSSDLAEGGHRGSGRPRADRWDRVPVRLNRPAIWPGKPANGLDIKGATHTHRLEAIKACAPVGPDTLAREGMTTTRFYWPYARGHQSPSPSPVGPTHGPTGNTDQTPT